MYLIASKSLHAFFVHTDLLCINPSGIRNSSTAFSGSFPYRFSTKCVKPFVVFMKEPLLCSHGKVSSIVIQCAWEFKMQNSLSW